MTKCSKCGSANPVGKKFCGDCGESLSLLCTKCATPNNLTHKFCKECGEKLAKQSAKPTKEAPCPIDSSSTVASTKKPAKPLEFLPLLAIVVVLIILTGYVTFVLLTGTHPASQSPIYCGNAVCDEGESCSSCANDCKCPAGYDCVFGQCIRASYCGDGVCTESCSSCPQDCGLCTSGIGSSCASNADCDSGYCLYNICSAVPAGCGDSYCSAGETRATCSADCGASVEAGFACSSNGDCVSGICINSICRTNATPGQTSEPSGYSVSWSPLNEEGFWTLFPPAEDTSSDVIYAPGGLYGLTTTFVNGASVRYDYWRDFAEKHCLERMGGESPQNIRAAAEDPTKNCERFNLTGNASS